MAHPWSGSRIGDDGRVPDLRLSTADGELLHAQVWPSRSAGRDWVVLAHGFSGSTAVPAVRAVAAGLAARATVLAYDARGHGRSTGLSTLGAREVLDVDAAVARARAGGALRVATVGFSMGAAAVVRHAAGVAGYGIVERPDAVVAVSGTGAWSTPPTATWPMRRLHLLVQTAPGRLVTRVLLRTRVDPAGWATAPVSPADCVTDVSAPLLVVHGDRDGYLRLDHARALAARAGTVLWVETGFGHAEVAISAELVDRIGRHVAGVFAGLTTPSRAARAGEDGA